LTSKSKAKGGAWERDVARYLSETYSAPFIRVPNSGAYTGGTNASRKIVMSDGQIRHMKGDVVPPDNWQHFNCECKNYSSFPFHHLLFNKEIPLLEGWLQQIKDAADPGDINILFMKITRVGRFVGFESSQNFETHRHVQYTDREGVEWKLTEFDSFFELNRATFEKVHS